MSGPDLSPDEVEELQELASLFEEIDLPIIHFVYLRRCVVDEGHKLAGWLSKKDVRWAKHASATHQPCSGRDKKACQEEIANLALHDKTQLAALRASLAYGQGRGAMPPLVRLLAFGFSQASLVVLHTIVHDEQLMQTMDAEVSC